MFWGLYFYDNEYPILIRQHPYQQRSYQQFGRLLYFAIITVWLKLLSGSLLVWLLSASADTLLKENIIR